MGNNPEKPDTKIPVLFQTLKDFNLEDTRFTKVKIWLMHLGENLNGSYFSREVVEKAIPTLANTPIMGLIDEDSGDFEGHERELEVTEDDYKFKNITVPYGVIPEYNNAHFEDRVGDDGVTRTYLTVEGLLWNKWEEAIEVLNSKYGVTGQSMELAEEFSGRYDDDFIFHFTEFKFDGACLLGDQVLPAMQNSTVEISFSEKASKIIQEKLEIYSRSIEEEGGNEVPKELEEKFAKEEEAQDEDKEEKVEEPVQEDPPAEEPPAEEEPADEEPADEEPADEKGSEEETKPAEEEAEETPEEEEEPSNPEELETIKEETITEARQKIKEDEENRPAEVDQIIVSDKVYSVEEATDIIKKHFELLADLHKEKVDALFSEYAESLTEEELSELKKDAYSKDIKDLETAIFAAIGRKNFAKKSKEAPDVGTIYSVDIDTSSTSQDPYNGAISKYLKK